MAEPALRRMTLDEFLRWEDGTDTRYELSAGAPFAMAPPAARHSLLATALAGEIRSALRSRPPCRVYGEAGIAVEERNDTCYVADLAASCQPLKAEDRLIRGPFLIVEILPQSTAAFDRQINVADYRRIDSIEETLFLASNEPYAELHRRCAGGWMIDLIRGDDGLLSLRSVGIEIPLATLHEGLAASEGDEP